MKKKYLILLLLMIIIPFKVFGEQNEITADVNDPIKSFKVGDIELKDVKFVDNSNNSSLSFGLSGSIMNNNDNNEYYDTKVYFYDKDNILLASSTVNHIATAGEGIFSHFLDTSILYENKVSDIKSYKEANEAPWRMICVDNNDNSSLSINGTVDFTTTGLGINKSDRKDMSQCLYGDGNTKSSLISFCTLLRDISNSRDK